uniref:rRNA processing protein EBP2 n=1 Tax=Panagrolaimus sp. PS1159 TaxID=55785 RepID=A0AC35GAU4_9BILA
MVYVFNERRFTRACQQKAQQRRNAYEAFEHEFAEIRKQALPILDQLQVLDLEDLRYEILRSKFLQLEKRAAQIAKILQKKKQKEKRKADEEEKKRSRQKEAIDEYTDDAEDRTPAFFIKEPGAPTRVSSDQGNSKFASRGGGRGRGFASRGGGFASRGGGGRGGGGRGGGFGQSIGHQGYASSPPPYVMV